MKVSIIIPCYNQGEYVAETLESVLNQSYDNWECIIIDDGSTDDSPKIAQKYVQSDSRIKYFKKENGGLSSARNFGIMKSGGSYILPLDADDTIGKTYLEEAINLFSKDNTIDLVYGRAEYFGEKIGEWQLPEYSYKKMLEGNQFYCSCIYKKQFLQNGMYDETMKSGYEDWEFLIRNLNAKSKVIKLDTIVFFYRIKKQSMWTEMNDNKKLESKIIEYVFQKNYKKYIQNYGLVYTIKNYLKYRLKNNFYIFFKSLKLIK